MKKSHLKNWVVLTYIPKFPACATWPLILKPDALYLIRKLLSYIPQNNMEDPPFVSIDDDPLRMDERLELDHPGRSQASRMTLKTPSA